MKLFDHLPPKGTFKNAVLTQGTFDGVHAGHLKIIERLKELAKQAGGETVLMTFHPHPRYVVKSKGSEIKLLSTIEERIELLREAGLDNIVVIPFTKEFASMEPEDFVKDILIERFEINTLVVGYDHRFGRDRRGDFDLLDKMKDEFGFNLVQIGPQEIEEITISSTAIRKALVDGDLKLANELLGSPYLLEAKVIHGQRLGRQIGFPTANLEVSDEHKLIPRNGVYAVKVILDGKKYNGMLNIGHNPTIEKKGFSIEVNIFKFAADIYDKRIIVKFVERLRDEIKFDSIESLKEQLQKDKINAENILLQES